MKLVVAVIKPFKLGQAGDIYVRDLRSALLIRAGETDAAAI
jgi:nitrogen regulatory protein PII